MTLTRTSRLRILLIRHFSKPSSDRPIYQAIARRRVRSILELGIATGQRALRMIDVAAGGAPVGEIRYTGVDLFEARSPSGGSGITLKSAYRLLKRTGAQVRLVPGDPLAALARTANSIGPTDLVVVSEGLDPASLAGAWFYLPRMLHAESLVLTEHSCPSEGAVFRKIHPHELDRLAASARGRRAA